jgi:hypothetical protein
MSIAHSPIYHHPLLFSLKDSSMVYAITTVCVPWQLEHNYLKISPPKQIQTKFCEGKQRFFWVKFLEYSKYLHGIFKIN